MPRYDYQCAACGKTFEVKLTFDEADEARPKCPKCNSKRTKRKLAAASMRRGRSSNRLTKEQAEAAFGLAQSIGGETLDGRGRHHDHADD